MRVRPPPAEGTQWKTTAEVAAMEHHHRSRSSTNQTSTKNTKTSCYVKVLHEFVEQYITSGEHEASKSHEQPRNEERIFLKCNQQLKYVPTQTVTKNEKPNEYII